MALRFPFRRFRPPLPVVPLGGQLVRPRPVVTVSVIGPGGSEPVDVLVDTGADDTTFSEDLATRLGIDLTHAPTRYLTGIGPSGYRVRYFAVHLRLTDGVEFREWPAMVAFTDAPLPFATLGFAGCLQFFTATFSGDRMEVELEVNPHYPGS
jgi:hypothetical protein